MLGEQPEIPACLTAVRDHSRRFADFAFVYPVISRRSRGLSLGVNLNPDKGCNFNCVYCEVNRAAPGRLNQVDLPRLREELIALIQFVRSSRLALDPRFNEAPALVRDIKDIAFSGDGEPTLVHNFAACVQTVAEVKQAAGLVRAKLVLITNATGLDKADVKRGLEILDANQGEIWAKLDAGTEAYFRQVNRASVQFDRILKNLLATARARPIVIQTLLFRFNGAAMPPAELDAYCARLNSILAAGGQIKEVQAYTIARPTPEPGATKLSPDELDAVAATIRSRTRLPVLTFP